MKLRISILLLGIVFVSCKNDARDTQYPVTKHNEPNAKTLEGAWELTSFYNYVDNKIADSFNTREGYRQIRSEEHTSELQSRENLVCRLLLEKKKKNTEH